MEKPYKRWELFLLFSPWFCFSIFLCAESLLSYSSIPQNVKPWLFLGGIFLPFFIAALNPSLPEKTPVYFQESLPDSSAFVWMGLITAACLVRFYKVTELSSWPLPDEGFYGFCALGLSEKWKWALSYGSFSFPAAGIWGLGILFKIFGPSLGTLWVFPAILSAMTVPMVYFCSRAFFSKSFSLILLAFWSFSFWPLYLGRLCLGHELVLIWLIVTFAAFGFFLREKGNGGREKKALLLGLCMSLGFYTGAHWAAVAFFVVPAFGWTVYREPKRSLRCFLLFLLPMILDIPIFTLFVSPSQSGYLHSVLGFQKGQLRQCWDYWSGLFWGVETTRFAYKPIWGGFLNAVEASFFFTGLLDLWRNRQVAFHRWVFFSFVIFLMPGMLSNELEMLRVILVLPLLLGIGAVGFQRLLLERPISQRFLWGVLGIILAGALGLYHLFGPYQSLWRDSPQTSLKYGKSTARWTAYKILSSVCRLRGPGLIFTDFDSTPFEQTLTIALYPINAARNPFLSPLQAQWAGILTNTNYAPFLGSRFPSIQWFPLLPQVSKKDDILILGLIPVVPGNKKTIFHWLEVNKAFQGSTSQVMQVPYGQTNPGILEELIKIRPLIQEDPFLESCLDERIFFAAMSVQKTPEAFEALQRGVTKGYPAANLFNDLGVLWFSRGFPTQARLSFLEALHCPVNHTPALDNLRGIPGP